MKMNKGYLVSGAQLRCLCGSDHCYLNVTIGHGYVANKKLKASQKDCIAGKNIMGFGKCKMNNENGICQGYMNLACSWQTMTGVSRMMESINGSAAITLDSVLLCRRGGIIVPQTSGQGMSQAIDWNYYLKRCGLCLKIFTLTGEDGCLMGHDPINLNTGNFLYEKEDLVICGINTISFRINYFSMEEYQGGSLGEGWHHNYEIYIEPKGEDSVMLHLGSGRVLPYRRSIGNVYVPLYGTKNVLKKEADGYIFVLADVLEYIFDKEGKLLFRIDKNNNKDIFIYNKNYQLAEVRGANGGVLYYFYNKEGNLYRVCDHTGREVQLHYSYRVLQKYINSAGQVYNYGYNENLRLESITTPRNILAVKNIYDSANRVLKQITPDGGIVELLYDDRGQCTYVRDQNEYITSYESDNKFRNIRTIYKDGQESFAYNDNNQKILYIDKNGNKTQYQYNEIGKLVGVINALGIQKKMSYDKEGKLLTVGIEGDKLLENIYDKEGYLVKTIDALGRSRQIIYNENSQPKQFILPDGSSIKFTYDGRGNVSSITDPYNIIVKYKYDDLNRLIEMTDIEENKISYRYDERDHLISLTNQEGAVRSYTYNESGSLIKVVDFDGGVVSIDYNVMGKPEKYTDKEGHETKLSYDKAGNLSEQLEPSGVLSVYEYDRNNLLIRARLMTSQQEHIRVIDYVYDPAGNLVKTQIGDGKNPMSVTSYEYDALNRIIAVIDPVGGKTTYTYNKKNGKISSITDAVGNQCTFRYNKMGELIEETDIKGNTTRFEYNALGRITSVIDSVGRTTKYYYSYGGRMEKTVYPNNRQVLYEYDRLGRLKKKTDQTGFSISYIYDCMGRILSVESSTGQKKLYSYDIMGNITSVTDANGNLTKYAYTYNGNLNQVIDAFGNITEYTYDKANRVICYCQYGRAGEENHIMQYERDVFGQVECIRDTLGAEEHFRYDLLGRMIEKTNSEGMVTVYTYTADGKPESIQYNNDNRVELEYTPLRQLSTIKDWLGEIKIERDNYGNPISITDHEGRTVKYEWGSMGQRQEMTYPDGIKIRWKYDNLLRPIQMKRIAEEKEILCVDYRYDKQGRISEKKSSGGYCTRWIYNESGNLEELSHEDSAGTLDKFHYTYDAIGNKIAIYKERRYFPEESGKYRYIYDKLQRLTDVEKDGKLLRNYRYDTFGNRVGMDDYVRGIKTIYEYDVLNRLKWQDISDNENVVHKTYTYDKRGNLTGEYRNGELLFGYSYNSMNRLEKAWNSQGKNAEYFYNSLGQRIGRIICGKKEDYLLDLTKPYHNLLELRKGKQKQNFYWDSNVTVMETESGAIQYYLQDELGSPLRVLYKNGYGEIYGYDEFGNDFCGSEKTFNAKNKYSIQGECQPFGYTGYRFDEISGTYFAQAREYQPERGVFTTEDVIRKNGIIPQALNRYTYCLGNPLKYIDLNGKEEAPVYVYYIDDFKREAQWQIKQLEDDGKNVIQINLSKADGNDKFDDERERAQMFAEEWNNMKDEKIESVYIFSHGTERMLQFEDGSSYNALTIDGWNKAGEELVAGDIHDLTSKNIANLYIQACNTGMLAGYAKNTENVASILSNKISNDGMVYSWDGSVSFGPYNIEQKIMDIFGMSYDLNARESYVQGHFNDMMQEWSVGLVLMPKGMVQYQNGKYYKNKE